MFAHADKMFSIYFFVSRQKKIKIEEAVLKVEVTPVQVLLLSYSNG